MAKRKVTKDISDLTRGDKPEHGTIRDEKGQNKLREPEWMEPRGNPNDPLLPRDNDFYNTMDTEDIDDNNISQYTTGNPTYRPISSDPQFDSADDIPTEPVKRKK